MYIPFPKKLGASQGVSIFAAILNGIESDQNDVFQLDLSQVEYIAHQEQLALTGLIMEFLDRNIEFRIILLPKATPLSQQSSRVKKQVVTLWEVWGISSVIKPEYHEEIFGITSSTIDAIKKELNFYPRASEVNRRQGVVRFVRLPFVNNYSENEIEDSIKPIYRLNNVILKELEVNHCSHPFTSEALSAIITEELYLNFLDHAGKGVFRGSMANAYMSIAFHKKLSGTSEFIQNRCELNFEEEWIPETKPFFYDDFDKEFRNRSYISFSFLDFGDGIAQTLREATPFKESGKIASDGEMLKYAFFPNTSRHPLGDNKNVTERFIPRGLFDVVSLARRYNGLLLATSNKGRIVFDFSIESEARNQTRVLPDLETSFAGTQISLCIPALEDENKFDHSVIKPGIQFKGVNSSDIDYLSIEQEVYRHLNGNKGSVYGGLLEKLRQTFDAKKSPKLTFLSFEGNRAKDNIVKKTIHFLITDYSVNHGNNFIVVNPPSDKVIDEIQEQILNLNHAYKNYKIHPLPVIRTNIRNEVLSLRWVGVYNKTDALRLNDLLLEEYSLAKSDFEESHNIIGHLIDFDTAGNLTTNFPNSTAIAKFLLEGVEECNKRITNKLLSNHDCIKQPKSNGLFLCAGNYYQDTYVDLTNLVHHQADCEVLAFFLFQRLQKIGAIGESTKFLTVTTKSELVVKAMVRYGLITEDEIYELNLNHPEEFERQTNHLSVGTEYILICDVYSTGFLAQRVENVLYELGFSLKSVGVIVSTRDKGNLDTNLDSPIIADKLVSVHTIPIAKRRISDTDLSSVEITRVNPHTQIPIVLSLKQTRHHETILFDSQVKTNLDTGEVQIQNEFLELVDNDFISVGYRLYNHLIHPYFFDTDNILKRVEDAFLKKLFRRLNAAELNMGNVQLFYPKKSGIQSLDVPRLQNAIGNRFVDVVEIERFLTTEGWRFPHNDDYLSSRIQGDIALILDDGSCSGDSIIQMIDEISFYNIKQIIVLGFIARIGDHKREFFSRISALTGSSNRSPIPISIYFTTHWHIPTYYLSENPTTREKAWIEGLLELENTPPAIEKIGKRIKKQLTPKDKDEYVDYKYLPLDVSDKVPKGELLKVRDQIGRVIGFRLYTESFKYFDLIASKYQKFKYEKGYFKELELLLSCFIYEPYLFDKLAKMLPDISDIIQRFTLEILFEREGLPNCMQYKWNKKDFIHLFFIVFKNEQLFKHLDASRTLSLVSFAQPSSSALHYVLYKLLQYCPTKRQDAQMMIYDGDVKKLFMAMVNEKSEYSKEIKRTLNFSLSLPSRLDVQSQIQILNNHFEVYTGPEVHREKLDFNFNVSTIQSVAHTYIDDLKTGAVALEKGLNDIQESWFHISNYLSPILEFSASYPSYLAPYPDLYLIHLTTGKNSLRNIIKSTENILNSRFPDFLELGKLQELISNIRWLERNFEPEEKDSSIIYRLLTGAQTVSFNMLINDLIDGLKDNGLSVDSKLNHGSDDRHVTIPELYVKKLVCQELIANAVKRSNNSIQINSNLDVNGNYVLEISNGIQEGQNSRLFNEGRLQGLNCLILLQKHDSFGFKYDFMEHQQAFVQTLTFKSIKR